MSDPNTHDWIAFHRLPFLEQMSSIERVFSTFANSDYWLFGLNYDVESDGIRYTYRTKASNFRRAAFRSATFLIKSSL
jgi:hypothetical protein